LAFSDSQQNARSLPKMTDIMSAMPQMVGVFYERGCGEYVVKTQQLPKIPHPLQPKTKYKQGQRDINATDIKQGHEAKSQWD
jgi:hypothetical protein